MISRSMHCLIAAAVAAFVRAMPAAFGAGLANAQAPACCIFAPARSALLGQQGKDRNVRLHASPANCPGRQPPAKWLLRAVRRAMAWRMQTPIGMPLEPCGFLDLQTTRPADYRRIIWIPFHPLGALMTNASDSPSPSPPPTPERNPVTPSNPNPKIPGDQGKTPGNTPPSPPREA